MNSATEFFQVKRANSAPHPDTIGMPPVRAKSSAAEAMPGAHQIATPEAAHAGAKEVDLGPGDSTGFPTWTFWGVTNVILTNKGPVRLVATLQAGAGGVLTFELAPAGENGSVVSTSGAWAGAVLWIKNASQDPSSLLHVEVW